MRHYFILLLLLFYSFVYLWLMISLARSPHTNTQHTHMYTFIVLIALKSHCALPIMSFAMKLIRESCCWYISSYQQNINVKIKSFFEQTLWFQFVTTRHVNTHTHENKFSCSLFCVLKYMIQWKCMISHRVTQQPLNLSLSLRESEIMDIVDWLIWFRWFSFSYKNESLKRSVSY